MAERRRRCFSRMNKSVPNSSSSWRNRVVRFDGTRCSCSAARASEPVSATLQNIRSCVRSIVCSLVKENHLFSKKKELDEYYSVSVIVAARHDDPQRTFLLRIKKKVFHLCNITMFNRCSVIVK